MIIKPATKEDVLILFQNPGIYDAVSSDYGPDITEWEIQDNAHYVGGYVENKVIGIYVLHRKNAQTGQVHIQVLPEFRREYAKVFGAEAIEYTFSKTKYTKLIAEIPSLYPNVIYFALKMGFKIDGRIDGIYRKNKEDHDVYMLSIERS